MSGGRGGDHAGTVPVRSYEPRQQQPPPASVLGPAMAQLVGAAVDLSVHLVLCFPSLILFERSNILATKSLFVPPQVKHKLRLAWPKWRRNKSEEIIITKIKFGAQELQAFHKSESFFSLMKMSSKRWLSNTIRDTISFTVTWAILTGRSFYQSRQGLPYDKISPLTGVVVQGLGSALGTSLAFPVYVWSFRARHHIPSNFYDTDTFSSGALPVLVAKNLVRNSLTDVLINKFTRLYYPIFYYFLEKEIKSPDAPTWRTKVGVAVHRAAAAVSANAAVALLVAPLHALLVKLLVYSPSTGALAPPTPSDGVGFLGFRTLLACVKLMYHSNSSSSNSSGSGNDVVSAVMNGFYDGFGWYLLWIAVEAGVTQLCFSQLEYPQ
eukprot:TRINITY_DN1270_c4_g1_i1.p1 TRINITY_DN1270_c4_g1~~TRINITY_DN1270_c4_g1_i1.p1  ORF type:complete len:380 (+),score=57.86 TRINITY_DN1270_c4_g1_i1:18-1157(+)